MVVQLGGECLVGCFAKPVSRQVQGYGKMFVLLYGGLEPLLSVLEEVVMSEERHCEWHVWTWWCQDSRFNIGVLDG